MSNMTRPRLNNEDIKLMTKIAKHNFVDMIYVNEFYKVGCKKRTINERISQLAKYEYLSIIYTFIPPEFTATHKNAYKIISLGSRGVELMNNMGYTANNNASTLKNSSPYRMYHQAQTSMVCDKIEQVFKDNDSRYEVHSILSEKEIFIKEGINMPDAAIIFKPKEKYILDDKEAYIVVFVEIERSYASPHRIKQKLLSYENSINDLTYVKKISLPIGAQRVLFVAQTDGQYETLKNKIKAVDQTTIDILLSKYSEVCNQSDARIFENPKNEKKYGLLSNVNT